MQDQLVARARDVDPEHALLAAADSLGLVLGGQELGAVLLELVGAVVVLTRVDRRARRNYREEQEVPHITPVASPIASINQQTPRIRMWFEISSDGASSRCPLPARCLRLFTNRRDR